MRIAKKYFNLQPDFKCRAVFFQLIRFKSRFWKMTTTMIINMIIITSGTISNGAG